MNPLGAAFIAAIGRAPAEAASPLRWSAPDECPDAVAVEERIVRLVGGAPATDGVVLDARVTRLPDGRGHALTMRTGAGATAHERTVTAATCDALADVAALVVAVTTEPVDTAEHVALADIAPAVVAPLESTPDETAVRGSSTRATLPRAPTPRRSRSRVEVTLRPRLAASIGALPGATAGGDLGLSVGDARVRGELVAGYWLPRRTGAGERALRVSLGTVSPRVCGSLPQPRVGVVACVGPELGVMRGEGNGATRRPTWIALALEIGARIRVRGRVSLWTSAGVAAPLRFPVFRVREGGGDTVELFRPAAATGRLLVGVEVGLGRREGKSP